MKAVMWTDVFQICMMIGGLLFILIKGSLAMGGMANVWEIAQDGGRIEFFKYVCQLVNCSNCHCLLHMYM